MGLCGLPPLKICGDDEGQQSLASWTIQEDNLKLQVHCKVVILGYGCRLLFGLGMGYLVFTIGKPKWLMKMVEREQRKKSEIAGATMLVKELNKE